MHKRILIVAVLIVVSLVILLTATSRKVTPQTKLVTFEASATPTPDKPAITCAGVTKTGNKCKKRVKTQGAYCWIHKPK